MKNKRIKSSKVGESVKNLFFPKSKKMLVFETLDKMHTQKLRTQFELFKAKNVSFFNLDGTPVSKEHDSDIRASKEMKDKRLKLINRVRELNNRIDREVANSPEYFG